MRVEKQARLALPASRDARIAAVSDTHAHPHPALLEQLVGLRPDAILHAGDVGSVEVASDLAAIAPLFAVRGNVDSRVDQPDVLIVDLEAGDRGLRVMVTHIALHGPRLRADVATRARQHRASMVVCGHSHVPFIGCDRDLTIFNPGASGPRRFSLPITFGTIAVGSHGVRLAHVDCETGRRWTPPG